LKCSIDSGTILKYIFIIYLKRFLLGNLQIILLFSLGIIPLLWLKQGYIIANGDDFPFMMNPQATLQNDVYLWSSHHIGGSQPVSSYMLYEVIWLFFRSLGTSVGTVQIIFHVFFFAGAGFFMYRLSKTINPEKKLAPLVSSMSYMFNLFVLQTRHNVGLMWTYVFLPLLMSQLVILLKAQTNKKSMLIKNGIYFAIITTVFASFASINVANITTIVLVLFALFLYYVAKQRRHINLVLQRLTKPFAILALFNIWWVIPILNYFALTPSSYNPYVEATSWSWTHERASFLNLFWLNGFWGWRPEYFPYYNSYSNPILIVLTFIPFILAATALLFKNDKSRFNAYLMLFILIFIFLSKGLHRPLGQLNLLLYEHIPGMTMFREPVSKFTMAIMPFLALLVGYAVDHIANMKIGNNKPTRLTKTLTTTLFVAIFIIAAYPLITNPIETKTEQLPFSSYIKIPDYWYQATDWLNNQQDNYKILITPPDDHYMMPYTWGYYGTDQYLERLIQKPIISTCYIYSYKTNPDITLALQQLQSTIKYNRTTEFKAFLDLLNIKYILQRNDVYYNFTGRNIIPPNEMQTFLTQQPYIHLAQKFGQLDIYEYTNEKPYLYILNAAILQQTTIKIENITILQHLWNFTSLTEMQAWQNVTQPDQLQINYTITQDNNALKAELWNSTWGWKTIDSPLFLAQYGNIYQIEADIRGQNAHGVHIKIAEYDQNTNILNATYIAYINDGTFNWAHTVFNYELSNKAAKYLQIQIWHGHETDKPFPNIVWIDNVQIYSYTTILNTTGLDLIFQNTTQNQPTTILNYTKINPTKITATVNATQPFILAISEALDQSWTAYANGKQYKPIPLYLGLKGFYINQTGLLDIVVEYEPQKWFYIGCVISLTTFIACTAYLTYSYAKTKDILQKLKQRLSKKT